jgi:glycosyltransferase involved in cell wall biosynthesis
MRITVAVCTWNRCSLLQQALEQMTKLGIPSPVEWELLVVNNNSTDATDEVIASFSGRLPVRGLFEPKPGKSHALNLAIREASGDYILWTDDDALVDEGWVNGYYEAFKRWPDAAIFGGPVEPWFDGVPPRWLSQVLPQIEGAYAVRHFSESVPLDMEKYIIPYGVNMAVRTPEQARYLYDTSIGPRPDSNLRGEEVTLVEKMMGDGIEGRWVPEARVRHYIPKHRQTIKFLRGFFFGRGELGGRRLPDRGERKLFNRPRWLWRKAVEAELRYRFRRVSAGPDVWIKDLIVSSDYWGQLRGYNAGDRA